MGRTNERHNYFMGNSQGNNRPEEVCEEKDLGAWISKDKRPPQQCSEAAKKANNVMRSIKKTFTHTPTKIASSCYMKCMFVLT